MAAEIDTRTSTGANAAPDPGYPARWAALFVILTAEVMDLMDALITSIAGPTIVRNLGGGPTLIQWLSAAYTVAMAAGLLVGGRLGDIVGRRTMFLVGMGGFTTMSLLCATAQSPAELIGLRAAQGLLGAAMLPQGLGLIKEMFPEGEQAKAFGAFGPVMGLSAVGGPILAGFLVDADLFGWGWRTIFAINVPLGIIALAAGSRLLPAAKPDPALRVDVFGATLACAAMVLVIYPLIQGRELGWPAWTYLMIGAGLVGFAIFALDQRARDRGGRVTLVTPSLFGKRAFTAGLAAGLALFAALLGTTLVFTLFVQIGLGFSPLKAGIAGIGQAIGMIVGFGAAQPLNARYGRRIMLTGQLITFAAFAAFVLTLHLAGDVVGILAMTPALTVLGIGMGLTMAPFFDIVLAGVDERESGSASGTLSAVQQLGGAFGIALLGTVFYHALDNSHARITVAQFRYAASFAMWVAAALILASFLLTFLLPRRARNHAH